VAGALARVGGQIEETRERAIRLAEVRIDRGDFAGFEQLRSTHATGDDTDERWSMLLGTAQPAQGRLTTALESFRRVLVRVDPGADPDLIYAARWHAIQALVVLNRLDEAEDQRLLFDPAGRGRETAAPSTSSPHGSPLAAVSPAASVPRP